MKRFLSISRISFICICFLLQPTLLFAQQDTDLSTFRITDVSVENFPEIQVSVTGDLPNGRNLVTEPIVIFEDGQNQPITRQSQQDVGVQVGIAIDPNNLTVEGNTQDVRSKEIVDAIQALSTSGLLRAETDWLAAFTIDTSETGAVETLSSWTSDHGSVSNTLLQTYQQPQANFVGPVLNTLLTEALEQFRSAITESGAPPPAAIQRFLVFFTDGSDSNTVVDVGHIIAQANELGVHIYPILLGQGTAESQALLRTLANDTNGRYSILQSQQDTDDVWESLSEHRLQQTLTYITSNANPNSVEVQLPALNTSDNILFPVTPNTSFEINIVHPIANQALTVTTATTSLPIITEFIWPDGNELELSAVRYSLSGPFGSSFEVQEADFGRYDFPINPLDAGSYVLEIEATNAFGGQARPQRITFDVVSSGVFLTPLWDTIQEFFSNTAIQVVGGIFLPLLILLALYVMRRATLTSRTGGATPDPTVVYRETVQQQPIVEASKIASASNEIDEDDLSDTEVIVRSDDTPPTGSSVIPLEDTEDGHTEPVKLPEWAYPAQLEYVEGGGDELPSKLLVKSFGDQKIGRSNRLSDIVIKASCISRQHATILASKDGYYLQDEGSAGGTFINQQQLGPGDKVLLEDGDLLNFNDAQYRFNVTKKSKNGTGKKSRRASSKVTN